MTPERGDFHGDWDALPERRAGGAESERVMPASDASRPARITVMAASWADLVGILAVCTGGLVAVLLLGRHPTLAAFGWAAGLALLWWLAAAVASIVVRQGTPGMLLAGVRFAEPVERRRLSWVLAAGLLGAVSLGLVSLAGSRRSFLAAAAASQLTGDDEL
jgi:hypothetical protein